MPEESNGGGWTLAQAGPGVALASALFGAMGFLATRSYLTGLGVPEHVVIAAGDYVQYGGRFFFALAAQLLPVGLFTALAFLLIAALVRRSAWLRQCTESGLFTCLFLAVVTCLTIGIELGCLTPEPVFSPGRIRNIAPGLRTGLVLIEAGVVLSIAWLGRWFSDLWLYYRDTLPKRILMPILLLAVLVEIMLLPVCFSRIQMIPRSFSRVTLARDKDPAEIKGILAFAGPESYFVFREDRILIEVAHGSVKEIRYESSDSLEQLAAH